MSVHFSSFPHMCMNKMELVHASQVTYLPTITYDDTHTKGTEFIAFNCEHITFSLLLFV